MSGFSEKPSYHSFAKGFRMDYVFFSHCESSKLCETFVNQKGAHYCFLISLNNLTALPKCVTYILIYSLPHFGASL